MFKRKQKRVKLCRYDIAERDLIKRDLERKRKRKKKMVNGRKIAI